MLHQIDRKVILGLADLIHIHNPFLMQFVFSSGVALLILAPALVSGSNAILFLRHPAVLDTIDNKLSLSHYFTVHADTGIHQG